MADAAAGSSIGESPQIDFDALERFSRLLPRPASAIVDLAQKVIVAAQSVPNTRDEANEFKTCILQLLVVVVAALYDPSAGDQRDAAIPPLLTQKVEGFLESLRTISKRISEIQASAVATSGTKRRNIKKAFVATSQTTLFQSFRNELQWAVEAFDLASHLATASNLCNVSREAQKVSGRDLPGSLPRAKYAGFDCERPDRPSNCLKGTRTALLKTIIDWICNPDLTIPRLFWLYGIAGVGKTTVARTVAEAAKSLGLLGANFFFSRSGEAELRNPALVFTTIAYQLARFDPEFNQCITNALDANPDAPCASLKVQLDELIVKPLAPLTRDRRCVVVLVFDAFDECEPRGAKDILKLLIAAMPHLPTALHDIEADVVKGDILLYLRHHLQNLTKERSSLPRDWITDSDIELLAEKARNLFVYASTAFLFLSKGFDPRNQLGILLNIVRSMNQSADDANPFMDLDKLYRELLLALIPPENSRQLAKQLRHVLGSIILLRDPLPVGALRLLVGSEMDYSASILEHLHSVILTPPPPNDCPRVYHPSFPDFLQDRNRCTNGQLWIDSQAHEGRMALSCLNLLNASLHKGMLGELDPTVLNSEVENLAARIEEFFPPELQYACRYWASHLANAPQSNEEIIAALEVFASRFLLPWMEAMSWLGDTGLAIRCLKAANLWQAKSGNPSSTATLLNDGYRLLLAHIPTIRLGAQHLAISVLPFAPSDAELTARYAGYANSCVKVVRGVDPDWSPCLMVWNGHSNWVTSVTYSPDGSRAASASWDKTIRLWGTTTGSCTATLGGHSNRVMSVAFSPDGSTLTSGSADSDIRTWDTTTGACTAVLKGHSSTVRSVAFCRDGSRLCSGSYDHTIRLWDLTIGTTIATFQGHSEGVMSVAFSPDGSSIASGSADKTIRIWDLTGGCVSILEGHSGTVCSVTFSAKGTHLASGSHDNTVRVWDTATRRCTSTLEGRSHAVTGVAFSPNGAHLASASSDKTIRVWDTATSKCTNTFRGHSDTVRSIASSPDGSRLISGSYDNTVRIWDATLTTPTAIPEGHSGRISSVAFSEDGSRLVSGSYNHTARIWDATTGHCLMKLEGHSDWLICVAFHPDGFRIATGSYDETVRLWDANTGDCIATLTGHSTRVTSLVFSANGAYLKSSDWCHNILFWDISKVGRVEMLDDSQFDKKALDPFKIDDGRLTRTYEDGSQHLVCILPPGADAGTIASFGLGGGRDRVAIGCGTGDVFILEISLPLD